jgi:hypothetical protein
VFLAGGFILCVLVLHTERRMVARAQAGNTALLIASACGHRHMVVWLMATLGDAVKLECNNVRFVVSIACGGGGT